MARRAVMFGAAAVVAVLGLGWFARGDSAPDATLDVLFDACARFAETGRIDGLKVLGLAPDSRGWTKARFAVEGGIVTLELKNRNASGPPTVCYVHGESGTGPDRSSNPTLSWPAAKARTDDWFRRKEVQPGIVRSGYPFRPDAHLLVACPRDGAGFAIDAGALAEVANAPLLFSAGRSAAENTLACITLRVGDGG